MSFSEKWERVTANKIEKGGRIFTEELDKLEIPEGTLYRSVVCYGHQKMFFPEMKFDQKLVFVPKGKS